MHLNTEGKSELSNLLARAAAALETPADLNKADVSALIADLVSAADRMSPDASNQEDLNARAVERGWNYDAAEGGWWHPQDSEDGIYETVEEIPGIMEA